MSRLHREELGLVLPDVWRPQTIGGTMEMLGEVLDEVKVTLCDGQPFPQSGYGRVADSPGGIQSEESIELLDE
jgi:hypothetical protein